jgi:hypothetical protein
MLAAIKRGYFLCIVFLRIPGRNVSVKLRILPFENCVNGKKIAKKNTFITVAYEWSRGEIAGYGKKKSH